MIGRRGAEAPARAIQAGSTIRRSTRRNLLTNAYDVKDCRIVVAIWTANSTSSRHASQNHQEQFRTMLQNLLAERFKLTIHQQRKELDVCAGGREEPQG